MEARVFSRFQNLAYTHAGIALKEGKEALVTGRVRKRMEALGIDNHKGYLDVLEADPSGLEMLSFLDVISTNFTSFFREPAHFDHLKTHIRGLKAKGQRRFRIWCAAASSGEEPYTLAMVMNEVLGANGDYKILATDISTSVIEKCKKGVYSAESVLKIPTTYRSRSFDKEGRGDDASYIVKEELRKHIVFKLLNLNHPPFPMKGPLDAIFCRNVMIYFDTPVRQRLITDFERLICPGGLVIVGQSETLTGVSHGFKTVCPSVYIAPEVKGAS
ncbi:MAG: protein-glutamate O-methyltransferase CheR [Deltaproteobacteria bacterium]|nr:protein-glutamate O-methyltransferase CheR [Deltaproteobacteria bacterium]